MIVWGTNDPTALRRVDPSLAARLQGLLAASRRLVIYAGGGVIASGTGAALTRLAETLGCPVALTLMDLGAMDARHPLCLGPLGMHGAWCANVADLVLALGMRFDDRVIGDPEQFAAHATIVHIDVDPAGLGKNKPVALGIACDLRAGFAGGTFVVLYQPALRVTLQGKQSFFEKKDQKTFVH